MVPSGCQARWISDGVGDWCIALLSVEVAGQEEVDRVVEKDRLEDVAAVFADVGAVVLEADVPGAMAR